jgi:ubiquinone/menaquinone biosynthesis C-methylase UbiE
LTTDSKSGQRALADRKTALMAALIRRHFGRAPTRILVVGCGSGREAAQLACSFGAQVVGIDLHAHFDADAARTVDLRRGDATAIEFPDGAFDFVYSYHTLEHIPDFRRALAEMRRVLVRHGGYCVGTPNRQRLVGYLGSANAGWREKVHWNLQDWKARLRGRFRNEYGAHAGFAREELYHELCAELGPAHDLTLAYYESLYARRAATIRRLEASGLAKFLFPCVYFFGWRAQQDNIIALRPTRESDRPYDPSRNARLPRDARHELAAAFRYHRSEGGRERR